MSEPTSREALLRVANLVRPALAAQPYIPILNNIYFDGASAMAYNDIAAITVRCNVDLDCCLPGELLIKALNSLAASEVIATTDKSTVLLSAGRSKIKLPSLPSADFPFDPKFGGNASVSLAVTDPILRGIGMCLNGVSNDPTHPAQMGVTLEAADDGCAVLYSTDNITLSRYQTNEKVSLPGNVPVILPTFFCRQLLALGAAFPTDVIDLMLLNGAILVKFGDQAELFTKLISDLEPLDIGRMISRHVGSIKGNLEDIPDGFDAALDRALMVLANETDKATKVSAEGGRMHLHSSSELGEATDSLAYKLDAPEFLVDPALLSRGAKLSDKIALLDKVVIMGGDKSRFTHLIAHCSV